VSTRGAGTFILNMSTTAALVQNNIMQGVGTPISGPATDVTNWVTSNAHLQDPASYNFHLTANSTGAINMGTTPGTSINGFNMNPTLQYVHPRSYESRPVVGAIDIGCYEYGTPGNQAPQVNAGDDQSITWPTNSVNLDGSVAGNYTYPQTSNNVYEAITEVIRGGGSLNYSWLEHRWTFSIPPNTSLDTIYVDHMFFRSQP
jgi:hypothetical protein